MTDIFFYHLTSTAMDQALPKLLEKALQSGFRAVVHVGSAAEADRINGLLWTYQPESFLPHGTAKDGYADQQPVYITEGAENPNAANLLMVTDGTLSDESSAFNRVLDIFNGADEQEVERARARWKHYSEQGHTLSYIKQSTSGGWEKQAI